MHLAAYTRHLRARNRSPGTIAGYRDAIQALAGRHPGVDVTDLTPADIDHYLIDMLSRVAATTTGIHFRSLRAFFNWAVREDIIGRSPMAGMTAPKPTDEPVPVVSDDDLRLLLAVCGGGDFDARRDVAIIRLWCEPGSPRVAEMAGLTLDDLDLRHDQVTITGKGDKVRRVPFGAKTGTAVDRYLRLRARHRHARTPRLWLGARGPLTISGLAQMLRRRSRQAGVGHIHPHQLRHTSAHNWADAGGSDQDAMVLFGWSSPEMPRLYGRSAGEERARRAARRASLGDRL
jgi:site-specific recombinase XerC